MSEERHWYAHSVAGLPQEAWQTLPGRLHAVVRRAAGFADAFGAGAAQADACDTVQLCAQALCLEEMLSRCVAPCAGSWRRFEESPDFL